VASISCSVKTIKIFSFPIDPGLKIAITSHIKDINPYIMPPGRELDEMIHHRLFGNNGDTEIPPYSVDPTAAAKVRSKLKSRYGHPVIVGETRMATRKHFARYDSDPSTATEVLAETLPLAICRLALLLMKRD
jgi:hypothetical protein